MGGGFWFGWGCWLPSISSLCISWERRSYRFWVSGVESRAFVGECWVFPVGAPYFLPLIVVGIVRLLFVFTGGCLLLLSWGVWGVLVICYVWVLSCCVRCWVVWLIWSVRVLRLSWTFDVILLIWFESVWEFFLSVCMPIWWYSWIVCIVFYHYCGFCVPVAFLPPGGVE